MNRTDPSLGWTHVPDDQIPHYLHNYQRWLVLADEVEPDPECREHTRQYLTTIIAAGVAEDRRRNRAALLGVPRDPTRFPAVWLDDLKARVRLDILCEEVLGAQLGPERGGKRQGPCPICKRGTNAFTVYLTGNRGDHYFCFRCGAAGDAINAVMQGYGDPFPQAVERLARSVGLAPPPPPGPIVSQGIAVRPARTLAPASDRRAVRRVSVGEGDREAV